MKFCKRPAPAWPLLQGLPPVQRPACGNTVPGPGSKGLGVTFQRNYQKWQEICVQMDTICENRPADTTFDFFGAKLRLPVLAAPVGAMKLHYGDKYDDATYNDLLVSACQGCRHPGLHRRWHRRRCDGRRPPGYQPRGRSGCAHGEALG